MELLKVEHLSMQLKQADKKVLLQDISLCISRQESVAIVGESGCGKSQLMRTILQLQRENRETQGSILWKGKDLCTCTESEMQTIRYHEIAMLFQDPRTALDPVFTIGYQMMEQCSRLSRQARRQKCIALLERVRIPDPYRVMRLYPHECSIGMCQRIWLAMLLGSDAELWIADEPTSALDVSVQADVLQLLSELRIHTKRAMIFITHDLRLVPLLCDRVYIMKDGAFLKACSADTLYHEKQDPYTASLLGSFDCI